MPRVCVVPYDAAWESAFAAIKTELEAAIGDLCLAIEHVGSTAVPGLAAKPCIDIDVVIEDDTAFRDVSERLAAIGYFHEGDLGISGREAFAYTDKPHLMKHHLYVCPQNSEELHRHITFRDFLRAHPDAADRYGRVKQDAAALFRDDIDRYIAYKTPCIEALYALCGLRTNK